MPSQSYREILDKAMERLARLGQQHAEIEAEIAKLRQFIGATIHMLPIQERDKFLVWFNETRKTNEARGVGLADKIREIFEQNPKQWFTVTKMRDALEASGFDFSDYMSNPLASISATLKRMRPKEAEYTEIEKVAAYRWKPNTKSAKLRKANRRREIQEQALRALYGDEWARFDPRYSRREVLPTKNCRGYLQDTRRKARS